MTLFIVATPIGNLGDITLRAVETLRTADLVAAEDTRTAKKLFARFDLHRPLVAFHAHSRDSVTAKLIAKLKSGQSIALISEAGTPGISDPGFTLIRAAIAANVSVVPIPGVSAVTTALSASGLPTDKFLYLGFLPRKKGRQKLLASWKDEKHTIIFFESPHRIERTIVEITEVLGSERPVVLARELTKIYEEFFRGTLAEASKFLATKKPRGEFTVLLGGL